MNACIGVCVCVCGKHSKCKKSFIQLLIEGMLLCICIYVCIYILYIHIYFGIFVRVLVGQAVCAQAVWQVAVGAGSHRALLPLTLFRSVAFLNDLVVVVAIVALCMQLGVVNGQPNASDLSQFVIMFCILSCWSCFVFVIVVPAVVVALVIIVGLLLLWSVS